MLAQVYRAAVDVYCVPRPGVPDAWMTLSGAPCFSARCNSKSRLSYPALLSSVRRRHCSGNILVEKLTAFHCCLMIDFTITLCIRSPSHNDDCWTVVVSIIDVVVSGLCGIFNVPEVEDVNDGENPFDASSSCTLQSSLSVSSQ